MKRLVLGFALASALLVFGPSVAGAKQSNSLSLDMYRAIVTQAEYADLSGKGYDIAAADVRGGGKVELQIVLDTSQLSALRKQGLDVKVLKNEFGVSAQQLRPSRPSAASTCVAVLGRAGRHPRRALRARPRTTRSSSSSRSSGRRYQGRELIALKVTAGRPQGKGRNAAGGAVLVEPARPRVDQPRGEPPPAAPLRRRLHGRATRRSRKLLKSTELWFVISANPDGYQYTFDRRPPLAQEPARQRQRRQITVADGVDPNRNSPSTGATTTRARRTIPSDETYRGPSAGSEPETQAMQGV